MAKIPNDILIAALAGYKLERQRIDDKIAAVEAMLGGKPEIATVTTDGSTGKRKKFSAAVRRRMAAAQKARWAKQKGVSEPAPEAAKPKRQISPAGMKNIMAATKARWWRQKAAAQGKAAVAGKTAPKATKKSASAQAAKKAPVKKTAAKRAIPTLATAAAGARR
jgi:hypothetical protein